LAGFSDAGDTRYSAGILLKISCRRLAATIFQSGETFATVEVLMPVELSNSDISAFKLLSSRGRTRKKAQEYVRRRKEQAASTLKI